MAAGITAVVEDISGADTRADIITEIGGAPEIIPGLKSETWGTQFLFGKAMAEPSLSHPAAKTLVMCLTRPTPP